MLSIASAGAKTGGTLNALGRAILGAWDSLPAWLWERRAGLSVSAAIHALLLIAAAIVFPIPPPAEAPRPESMSVDVLTGAEFDALTKPAAAVAPPPVTAAITPPPRVPPPELKAGPEPVPPLAHAPTILSGGALDRIARASLRSLDGDARFEQLCDIEAMEQIARAEKAARPEKTVAYAVKDTRIEGDTLVADGGAYLSKGHWYHLAFRCRATPDRRKVLSFDFATGEQFPDDDPALPSGDDD